MFKLKNCSIYWVLGWSSQHFCPWTEPGRASGSVLWRSRQLVLRVFLSAPRFPHPQTDFLILEGTQVSVYGQRGPSDATATQAPLDPVLLSSRSLHSWFLSHRVCEMVRCHHTATKDPDCTGSTAFSRASQAENSEDRIGTTPGLSRRDVLQDMGF